MFVVTGQALLCRLLPTDLHADSQKGSVVKPRWH
jgi:hypothetical protein